MSVQFGLIEERPLPAETGNKLLWLVHIDALKASHLAVRATRMLGSRPYIVGPGLDPQYTAEHENELTAPHVELVGKDCPGNEPCVRLEPIIRPLRGIV